MIPCEASAAVDPRFPPRHDLDLAQRAAIAQVCARIDRPEEWLADDGYEHTIVGGAVDGARTAWVERRSQLRGGWEDVDYFLRVRAGDALVREWVVDTYNPYFGCDVGELRFCGDTVAVIYREKHATIVCALAPGAAPRLRAISDDWQIRGDVVLHTSEARGLVEQLRLPDLAPLVPLPRAAAVEHLSSGSYDHSPAQPTDAAALQRRIAARLPPLPAATAEMLIGALAYRFWDGWPALASTYDERGPRRWNTPCWLPFYCHQAARGPDARALLGHLDVVASRPPSAHGPEDISAELACRHIAARCGELAAACRAGHLPEETSCYFWVDWSQAAFAGARALFPGGMWAAWSDLRPRARELRELGDRA